MERGQKVCFKLTSDFVFFPTNIQNNCLVIFVCRDGYHTGLTVVPVHCHGGVTSVLKSTKLT